jgi:carbonic anhydrase/acetyltransferase-like protein (isoleucine patch superfamily)
MALIKSVKGVMPVVGDDCFLAENATLAGDVVLGNQCSVWFNAVLRGDVGAIRIGNQSNIQDGVVVHATFQKSQTIIGNNVSVGHSAVLHGCIIEDEVLIGMGAIVMDNAVIGKGAIIAAGAIILENTVVPPGTLFAGVPAKQVKALTQEAMDRVKRTSMLYLEYAKWFD